MADSKIQWTDATWNPVRGCAVVSPGCANCYAMKQAHRFAGPGQPYEGLTRLTKGGPVWTGRARFVPEMLAAPLRWKRPRRVFVNSMSDLFHDDVADEQIAAIFGVMASCPQHTFQVLTKRPGRMRAWFKWLGGHAREVEGGDGEIRIALAQAAHHGAERGRHVTYTTWPLPNVWLGVSTENQKAADERIPLLLQTPAAVRFVSAEPLLGPLDLSRWMWPVHWQWDGRYATPEEAVAAGARASRHRQKLVSKDAVFLSWVIVGGESGPGARPCAEEWIARVVQQCAEAHVPCFVKQLGAYVVSEERACATDAEAREQYGASSRWLWRAGLADRKGGDPAEWPEALCVRQYPEVARG